jgi:UDP-N-acetylmuramoyl-tripeptide--D-alanyl-D-alanine ligase
MKSPEFKIQKLFEIFLEHKSVCTDSRKLKEKDIFFALKGPNFDGNKYVETALKKGAILAVSENPEYQNNENVYVVENSLAKLQELSRKYRAYLNCTVIGLTGSNGKTTTKELCYQVLSSHKKTFCTPGNLNNHIGVPLTILSTPEDVDYLIVEMGANAQGEIKFLSEICNPQYGLITNVGKAHLEGFGGVKGVIKGKTELYRYLDIKKGKIFSNQKNEILRNELPENGNVIPYLDYELLDSRKEIRLKIGDWIVKSPMYGLYNVENIIAAVTIGHYFKVPPDKISKAIADYNPDNNRSTIKKIGDHVVFLDAYNANPTSVLNSLKGFDAATDSPKIVILGDMLELGNDALAEHVAIIDFVQNMDFEHLFFIGEIYKGINPPNSYYSVADFQKYINIEDFEPSNILIKGSRRIKLESIFND